MRNNEILRLGLILFAITFSVALILALGNLATADKIDKLNAELQNDARQEVLPEAAEFEEVKVEGLGQGDYKIAKNLYAGKKDGTIVGYCVGVTPSGFGGIIDMIVGVDMNGKITGINIVSFSETPGLGTKAKEPKFADQFNGKNAANPIKVIKNGSPKDDEIVAISGATITSNAVADGTNMAIKLINEKVSK